MKSFTSLMFFFFLCLLTAGLPLQAGVSTGSPGTEPGQPVTAAEDFPLAESGMITLSAMPVGAVNRVQWSMVAENGGTIVTVERAAGGSNEWVALAAFRPENSTGELREYDYIDAVPLTEASYRLRVVQPDGRAVVTEVVQVLRAADLFNPQQAGHYAIETVSAQ